MNNAPELQFQELYGHDSICQIVSSIIIMALINRNKSHIWQGKDFNATDRSPCININLFKDQEVQAKLGLEVEDSILPKYKDFVQQFVTPVPYIFLKYYTENYPMLNVPLCPLKGAPYFKRVKTELKYGTHEKQ